MIVPRSAALLVAPQGPGIDLRKGDVIDRLAALLQRARLWARRERRRVREARANGDEWAIHAARLRYRRALRWRSRLYQEYVDAVLAAYA